MEIKTLKDITFFGISDYTNYQADKCREELRKEAIKWYHRSDGNKHKFIREFFNITEQDCVNTKETAK